MQYTEVINHVIELARPLNSDDMVRYSSAEHQVEKYLYTLSAEQVNWMITIMYVGRTPSSATGLDDLYESMTCSPGPDRTAKVDNIEQMVGKAPLANICKMAWMF